MNLASFETQPFNFIILDWIMITLKHTSVSHPVQQLGVLDGNTSCWNFCVVASIGHHPSVHCVQRKWCDGSYQDSDRSKLGSFGSSSRSVLYGFSIPRVRLIVDHNFASNLQISFYLF